MKDYSQIDKEAKRLNKLDQIPILTKSTCVSAVFVGVWNLMDVLSTQEIAHKVLDDYRAIKMK